MKNLQLEQIPPYYEILMKVVNFTASLNLQYFFTFGLGSNIWEENLSESILSFFFVRLLKFEVNGIKVLQLETATGAAIRGITRSHIFVVDLETPTHHLQID